MKNYGIDWKMKISDIRNSLEFDCILPKFKVLFILGFQLKVFFEGKKFCTEGFYKKFFIDLLKQDNFLYNQKLEKNYVG